MFPARTLLVLIVTAVPAFSQPQKEISPVLLRSLRTVVLPSAQELRSRCSSAVHIYACTAFEHRNLGIRCESDASEWRMRVSFELTPVMYLWNAEHLGHELLHLGDISEALGQYTSSLESRRYRMVSDCQRAAKAESAGFDRQVSVFIDASNKLRHSIYR